jgi:hypothetical protein
VTNYIRVRCSIFSDSGGGIGNEKFKIQNFLQFMQRRTLQKYLSALLAPFGTVHLNAPIPRDPQLRVFKHPSRGGWGTEFLEAITAGTGARISPEVRGEATLVDVLFEPNPQRSRDELGVLGKLLSAPCIIECPEEVSEDDLDFLEDDAFLAEDPAFFDDDDDDDDDEFDDEYNELNSLDKGRDSESLHTALHHWLMWNSELNQSIIPVDAQPVQEDESSSKPRRRKKVPAHLSLLIMPTIEPKALTGFGATASELDVAGIYRLAPAFSLTIVVTSELPRSPETLWLRLLGTDETREQAIADFNALDHPLKAIVQIEE